MSIERFPPDSQLGLTESKIESSHPSLETTPAKSTGQKNNLVLTLVDSFSHKVSNHAKCNRLQTILLP